MEVYFRQEHVVVNFRKQSKLGVVTLLHCGKSGLFLLKQLHL